MTQTTMEQVRRWRGPAVLSFGFRPFFLVSALWAALAMGVWLLVLAGHVLVPTAFDPVSWHAHEFLFGYLGAAIAGFLLTAVPNWTGRLPLVGWRLGGLVALWLAGRFAVVTSGQVSPVIAALVDLAFPVVLAGALAREIVAGRNWRNLVVLGMLAVFTLGNALFHWEAARGGYAASGMGLRIGLGAAIMMIAVIGGRIIPSFTRNWLAKGGTTALPAPPMQRLDRAVLLVLLVTLLSWAFFPSAQATGWLLLFTGALHLVRLARWRGLATLAEPLVAVLHAGYLFVPLGALALGLEILRPGTLGMGGAQHLWMGGAVGLMTLAVMTRATLGHTGRPLSADAGTVAVYWVLAVAVAARVAAGASPGLAGPFHAVSGVAWMVAFGGFCILYGPLLLRPRGMGGA